MSTSNVSGYSARDQAEIARSAREAKTIGFVPVERSQVDRYLNPPRDTPWSLEYAYWLAGDLRGKIVLDLGCGNGENVVPLVERGAMVTGIDISADLIDLAKQRIDSVGAKAAIMVGSAYQTGMPDASVDVIFCIALVHHLEIQPARAEMLRVLKPSGFVVLLEPIRFSKTYDRLRKLLQPGALISEYEHPLTRAEFACLTAGFEVENLRLFRLPFVPLVDRALRRNSRGIRRLSAWMIQHIPGVGHYATGVVARLRKQGNGQCLRCLNNGGRRQNRTYTPFR